MGKRFLVVRRRGYYRGPYTYRRKGKLIRVRGHYVPPTTFRIPDRGAPGRGPKLIKVRKGAMTKKAIELGYIEEGQRISDIPDSRIDDFALDLAKEVGPRRAFRMFLAQKVFRKRARDGFKDKMEIAMETIKKHYEKELAPKEAIRAWKQMPPEERSRRMPGGRI